MVPHIDHLTAEEQEALLQAFPQIAVLVAGADGKIDQEEINWSNKIADMRTYSAHESLQPFYQKLDETFSDRFDALRSSVSSDVTQRQAGLTASLSKLNDILPKIDQEWAARFYKDLLTFAEHIAKASGGIFRIGAINRDEAKVLGLPMINPVVFEGLDEETEEEEQQESED